MAIKSFSSLKKGGATSVEKLAAEAEKMEKKGPDVDSRFWSPQRSKDGNGSAIIRFLPPPKDEDLPWVRYWDHACQGPGGWYIEMSLTTLGKDDPMSKFNQEVWAKGTAGESEIRKGGRSRRLNYVTNVYIIKDPANPANEGKVFLYRFGKKIWDKIKDAMSPPVEGMDKLDPFNFWEGANFNIVITTTNVDGKKFPNYDKSSFGRPGPLMDEDSALEDIWNQQHSLSELVSEDKFKSYEALEERVNKVFRQGAAQNIASAEARPQRAAPAAQNQQSNPPWNEDDDSGGIDFRKMLEEDDDDVPF